MRVLHVGCEYLPSNGGNVVRMRHMVEFNHNAKQDSVFIMTTTRANNIFSDRQYHSLTGVKIIRVMDLLDMVKVLRQVIRKYNIEIIVTHTLPANVVASVCAPVKIPIVNETHSLIQSPVWKMIGKKMLHKVFLNRRNKAHFVLSMHARDWLIHNYGIDQSKITFLPNGSTHVDNVYQRGNLSYFTFGYIGTFYHWQGVDEIRRNLDGILNIDKCVRLVMVGSGYLESEFRQLARDPMYGSRLIVPGMVSHDDIKSFYDEIDIVLIPRPSTLETETAIPLKIFEAISHGKPVVMSNVGGLLEVLGPNEAFVYDNRDVDGLVKACITAFMNPGLCRTKRSSAATRLKSWPSWDDVHRLQRTVLESLV